MQAILPLEQRYWRVKKTILEILLLYHLLAVSGRIYPEALPVYCGKMLQAIETTGKSDVSDGLTGSSQQNFCMVQPYFCKILVRRNIHNAFKNAAEVKRTYQAMLCQLLKQDVLIEVLKNIALCFFNGAKMKLL